VTTPQWICCQKGARENYSIPRALYNNESLALLVTEAWADRFPWKALPGSRASRRFHPAIPSNLVASFDWPLLAFELIPKPGLSGWSRTMANDHWFQTHALKALESFSHRHPGSNYTLFSYSYDAQKLFEFAKGKGWRTVLGQIDPGVAEARIVSALQDAGEGTDLAGVAPPEYWQNWRQECQLADRIIVNSEWSRQALFTDGVPEEKIRVIPLAYDPPPEAAEWVRRYPAVFSPSRPLRVLFLGLINLRKGVREILEAIPMLEHRSVEFWMVGPIQMDIPASFRHHPKVKWFGAVSRSEAMSYYREADVFLFPTHSDGFGLTQLEAQSSRLPAIASRNCGGVFSHMRDGYVLDNVEPRLIADAIGWFLEDPRRLELMASQCEMDGKFTLSHLSAELKAVAGSPAESRHEALPR
jgi:glycosyltransferase involved in cell wall biosynthesis